MKILNYFFLIIVSLSLSFEAFSETRKMEYRCEKVPETGARGFYIKISHHKEPTHKSEHHLMMFRWEAKYQFLGQLQKARDSSNQIELIFH